MNPHVRDPSIHFDDVQRELWAVTTLTFCFKVDGQLELMMSDGRCAMRRAEIAEHVLSRDHWTAITTAHWMWSMPVQITFLWQLKWILISIGCGDYYNLQITRTMEKRYLSYLWLVVVYKDLFPQHTFVCCLCVHSPTIPRWQGRSSLIPVHCCCISGIIKIRDLWSNRRLD